MRAPAVLVRAAERTRHDQVPLLPTVVGAAVAVLTGAAMAHQIALGLAVLLALGYVAVVVCSVRLAVLIWIPTVFFQAVPAFNRASKAAGLLVLVVWLGSQRGRSAVRTVLTRHRRMGRVLACLLAWLTLSVLWAADPGRVAVDLWRWYALILIFLIVATVMADGSGARDVVVAFVAGAVTAVAVALAAGNVGETASNVGETGESAAGTGGQVARLAGPVGDPNYFGMWLLAGLVLAIGLASVSRGWARLLAGAAAVVLAAGTAMTLSRGAYIAAAITAAVALVIFKQQRLRILALALAVTAAAFVWISVDPTVLGHITRADRADGRLDLWTVAASVVEHHPVLGVGLNNFRSVASDYLNTIGPIPALRLIFTDPHEVHNVYLQLLSEVGVVGLVLFLAFLVACLVTLGRAAQQLKELGDRGGAALANTVLLAIISMAAAGFFLSSVESKLQWVLMALGPALLAETGRSQVVMATPGHPA